MDWRVELGLGEAWQARIAYFFLCFLLGSLANWALVVSRSNFLATSGFCEWR